MSHWMTSGKNRLKAKENRSFAHRAQSRAVYMGFQPIKRYRRDLSNVQKDHPRFLERTASKYSLESKTMSERER